MNDGELYAASDIRLKENIRPISEEFIDKLNEDSDFRTVILN